MKIKKRNPFRGSWSVVLTQYQNDDGEWVTYKRFNFGQWAWDFHQECRIFDGRLYSGVITQSAEGRVFIRHYSYSTENAILYVASPDYYDLFWECDNETYRICAKRGALILYDVTEPDAPGSRIFLKRNNPVNRLAGKILFLRIKD